MWDSPLVVLWCTPVLFGAAVLFDNDFIGSGLYAKPVDGMSTSALLSGAIPMLFLLPHMHSISLADLSATVVLVAVLGALMFLGHLYFYFLVLFTPGPSGGPINDGAKLELFLNLNVIFVPVCALVLLNQVLSGVQWLGVLLIAGAGLLLTGVRGAASTARSGILSAAFLGAYVLCEEYVYSHSGFASGFFLFAMTLLATGLLLLSVPATRPRRAIFKPRNFSRCALAETIGVVALLCSHRALELNPVAYVVAAESFGPIMVSVLSLIPSGVLSALKLFASSAGSPLSARLQSGLDTYAAQRADFQLKLLTALIMAAGAAMLIR